MKSILIAAAVLLSTTAKADWDSVAVIYRPEKVLVQINERASANFRLDTLMTELGFDKKMIVLSADKSLKLDCERNAEAATCILRFQPSPTVTLEPRKATADVDLSELKLPLAPTDLGLSFLNSNGDYVNLKVHNGRLQITAAKR